MKLEFYKNAEQNEYFVFANGNREKCLLICEFEETIECFDEKITCRTTEISEQEFIKIFNKTKKVLNRDSYYYDNPLYYDSMLDALKKAIDSKTFTEEVGNRYSIIEKTVFEIQISKGKIKKFENKEDAEKFIMVQKLKKHVKKDYSEEQLKDIVEAFWKIK